jgi:GMP synthase (glutamine-hydrolysing)
MTRRLNTVLSPFFVQHPFAVTMKTACVIRHVAFEDLGTLAPVLQSSGYQIQYIEAGVTDLRDIDLQAVDLLVVLGGPIGAEDDALYPFLIDEVQLVQQRLASQRPILGICLGAQIMARALGARVQAMGVKEIGFSPLAFSSAGQASVLAELGQQSVLHWHGDQFALPNGLPSLAATPVCPHQAFSPYPSALGLQFHLEANADHIEQWLVGHALELSQAGVDLHALRQEAKAQAAGLQAASQRVMRRWLAIIA